MISLLGLMLKGPGKFIPVFFLSLQQAALPGQVLRQGTGSAALGGSFVCLQDHMCSFQNQAGLGFVERSSLSIQHARPFLLRDLGISSLSAQVQAGKGAIGMAASTMGLKGLRQSSLWLACGQRFHPQITAGVGLHFWSTSIRDQFLFAPGLGYTMGLQIRFRKTWILGARLSHPFAWSRSPNGIRKSMGLQCGFARSIFDVGQVYAQANIQPGIPIILSSGAQWKLNRQIIFRTGIRSGPLTFTWGLQLSFSNFLIEFSGIYSSDTGLSPLSALSYEW